jgi:hypothetical protein
MAHRAPVALVANALVPSTQHPSAGRGTSSLCGELVRREDRGTAQWYTQANQTFLDHRVIPWNDAAEVSGSARW